MIGRPDWSDFEEYSYSDRSLSMADFVAEWEMRQEAAKAAGCEYSEAVLAFKVLVPYLYFLIRWIRMVREIYNIPYRYRTIHNRGSDFCSQPAGIYLKR